MEITVNEQPQQFYLAMKTKWAPAFGHEIKVGKYLFCAIPVGNKINISEITSGAKVHEIPFNDAVLALTETKDGTMQFLIMIGKTIKQIIDKQDNFDKSIDNLKKIAFDRLGEMPNIKDVEV
jgi:hypothetical protein